MKSSKGSSTFTVVKFSCRMPIFFSLSHPDGLRGERDPFQSPFFKMTTLLQQTYTVLYIHILYIQNNSSRSHEDRVLLDYKRWRGQLEVIQFVHDVFIQEVQILLLFY